MSIEKTGIFSRELSATEMDAEVVVVSVCTHHWTVTSECPMCLRRKLDEVEEGNDFLRRQLQTAHQVRMDMARWMPVGERMPQAMQPALATVLENNRLFVVRAVYAPKFGVEDYGTFQGDTDYHEERDCFYWPEGWYEWNEHEDTHWRVDGEVLAWMPLPEPYKERNE